VFSRGWTLDAAEAVCDGDLDVIDGLGSLLDKNLVRLEGPEEEPRFAMLETIREYALEKLRQSGAEDALRDRHRGWAVAFAERAEPELRGPDQESWLERLHPELDNFRSAFAWSIARGEPELALRLGSALLEFWMVRADWNEGSTWLERARALPGEVDPAVRMKALRAAGELADALSDYPAATKHFEESLAVGRALGDRRGIAEALLGLASEAERVGKYADARPLLEESVTILNELGDEPSLARSLGGLAWLENDYRKARKLWSDTLAIQRRLANRESVGWTLIQVGHSAQGEGDYTAARAAYGECLSVARGLGYERMTARALTQLGDVALLEGDAALARALFEESLPIWREIGHRSGLIDSLRGLGDSARLEGEFDTADSFLEESRSICREIGARPREARTIQSLGLLAGAKGDFVRAESLFAEALACSREMDDVAGAAEALRGLGEAAEAQGRLEPAVRALAASEALREQVGAALAPGERASYERAVAAARTGLGDEAFHELWSERELIDERRVSR
jgi:tetratricopeptide (TPR) repeat protein